MFPPLKMPTGLKNEMAIMQPHVLGEKMTMALRTCTTSKLVTATKKMAYTSHNRHHQQSTNNYQRRRQQQQQQQQASAMLRAHLFSIVDCDMGTAKDDPSYARGVWRIPHAKSRTSFVLRCTGKVCLRTSFEPFLIHFGGEVTSRLPPVRASLRVP